MAQATCAHITIPSTLRARIMRRAWELFAKRYNYPRTPFRSIGARCFAACLKSAWFEAKEIVRLAALGADRLKRLIDTESMPKGRIGISTLFWERSDDMIERYRRIDLYTKALDLAVAS